MSSLIHFKFKSEKINDKLYIEGPFITTIDCKRAIAEKKKLNCDLILINPDTNDEYDNQTLISHNSSIIVKRVPITESTKKTFHNKTSEVQVTPNNAQSNYQEKDEHKKIEDLLSQNTYGTFNNYPSKVNQSLHPSYICYRCGKPGHYIKHCPTNGDPNFDIKSNMHGVPRNYDLSHEEKVFEKISQNFKRKQEGIPHEFLCPICKKIIKDAVQMPCCSKNFCDICLRDELDKLNFNCPCCKKTLDSLENITSNYSMRSKIIDYSVTNKSFLNNRDRENNQQMMADNQQFENKEIETETETNKPNIKYDQEISNNDPNDNRYNYDRNNQREGKRKLDGKEDFQQKRYSKDEQNNRDDKRYKRDNTDQKDKYDRRDNKRDDNNNNNRNRDERNRDDNKREGRRNSRNQDNRKEESSRRTTKYNDN